MNKSPSAWWIPFLLSVALFACDVAPKDDSGETGISTQNDSSSPELEPALIQTSGKLVLPPFQWRRLISKDPMLMYPLRKTGKNHPGLLVEKDCVVSEEGVNGAQVDISFVPVRQLSDYRLDIAVTYQGFEQNKYSCVWPLGKKKPSMIPGNSQFLEDTLQLINLKTSLFPEVFVRDSPGEEEQFSKRKSTVIVRKLAPGTTYRFRLLYLIDKAWTATSEILVIVPICPNDQFLKDR